MVYTIILIVACPRVPGTTQPLRRMRRALNTPRSHPPTTHHRPRPRSDPRTFPAVTKLSARLSQTCFSCPTFSIYRRTRCKRSPEKYSIDMWSAGVRWKGRFKRPLEISRKDHLFTEDFFWS